MGEFEQNPTIRDLLEKIKGVKIRRIKPDAEVVVRTSVRKISTPVDTSKLTDSKNQNGKTR